MQINNTSDLLNIYTTVQNSVKHSAQNSANTDDKTPINSTSLEQNDPLFFKSMTRSQIQSYFAKSGIEDDNGRREDALIGLQKFSNTLEPNTYSKMVDSLLDEADSSQASMRYTSFPASEILFEDPKLFRAQLQTTLEMKDTQQALIFSVDLEQDYKNYMTQISNDGFPTLENEEEFPPSNFMGFLLKKFGQMQEESQKELLPYEQNRLDDYTSLLKNYNDSEVSKETSVLDILV